jgi:hypothetical protein
MFVDIQHFFSSCDIHEFHHRTIKFVDDSLSLKKTGREYICLYNLIQEKNEFELEIGYRDTGAYGSIRFRKEKNKMRISKIAIGYF